MAALGDVNTCQLLDEISELKDGEEMMSCIGVTE